MIRDDITVLHDGVERRGHISDAELAGLYQGALALVMPSRLEGAGLPPLEAALSRCAVVANDIPTFHELWGDSAYYFRQNDADSLAAAIRELNRNPHLRIEYQERAYLRARQQFTADQMVDTYARLYSRVAIAEAAA